MRPLGIERLGALAEQFEKAAAANKDKWMVSCIVSDSAWALAAMAAELRLYLRVDGAEFGKSLGDALRDNPRVRGDNP